MDKFNYKPKHAKNKNFVMTPQFVREHGYYAKMSLKAKAVWYVIATHANYETHNSIVNNETIAIEAGLNVKSVVMAKQELEKMGLIKRWQAKYNTTAICHVVFDPNKIGQIVTSYKDKVGQKVISYPKPGSGGVPEIVIPPTGNCHIPYDKLSYLNRLDSRLDKRKGEVTQNEPLAQTPKEPNQNHVPLKSFESPKGLGPIIKKSVQEISDEKIMNFLKRMTVQELCSHLVRLGYEPEEVIAKLEVL